MCWKCATHRRRLRPRGRRGWTWSCPRGQAPRCLAVGIIEGKHEWMSNGEWFRATPSRASTPCLICDPRKQLPPPPGACYCPQGQVPRCQQPDQENTQECAMINGQWDPSRNPADFRKHFRGIIYPPCLLARANATALNLCGEKKYLPNAGIRTRWITTLKNEVGVTNYNGEWFLFCNRRRPQTSP